MLRWTQSPAAREGNVTPRWQQFPRGRSGKRKLDPLEAGPGEQGSRPQVSMAEETLGKAKHHHQVSGPDQACASGFRSICPKCIHLSVNNLPRMRQQSDTIRKRPGADHPRPAFEASWGYPRHRFRVNAAHNPGRMPSQKRRRRNSARALTRQFNWSPRSRPRSGSRSDGRPGLPIALPPSAPS